MSNGFSGQCRVCGKYEFAQRDVLWPELICEWELSPLEAEYINRQQGFYCIHCGNNLRSISLADAICSTLGFSGPLAHLGDAEPARALRLLEINPAGGLSGYLRRIRGHQLVSYPEHDMCSLTLDPGSFDMVVHSDTLEHVPDPVRGLSECRRMLKSGGACIFTIPIVVDRMTRTRCGLPPSYHGAPGVTNSDQIVCTEFGADFWKAALEAGFPQCTIHAFEYPAALAVIARA